MTGVGQVTVGGGALPAVRVELNPNVLNKYGVSLEQVRTVLAQANAHAPKGQLADARTSWEIHSNDQLLKAADYVPLIVAASNGAIVRLTDVGEVSDSVQDVRAGGLVNGQRAVAMVVTTAPGANVIDTVDRIRAALPRFRRCFLRRLTCASASTGRRPFARRSTTSSGRSWLPSPWS